MRYFLEMMYRGGAYSGFQVQENANTIQAEVEKAFAILHREQVEMTGSSRTDAGVHALQNFFHFDFEGEIHRQFLYKLNAILPPDIVARGLYPVEAQAHCRFDAVSREYRYYIYRSKDPFRDDRAYYFPYTLDFEKMNVAASVLMQYRDFTSFSKRNTQVKSFHCEIMESEWICGDQEWVYRIRANRFLRGMVRALVATMLKLGRGKMDLEQFKQIIEDRDCTAASFAVPAKGLFLCHVEIPYVSGVPREIHG